MYSLDEKQDRLVKSYARELHEKLVEVVGAAEKTMKPAQLSWSNGLTMLAPRSSATVILQSFGVPSAPSTMPTTSNAAVPVQPQSKPAAKPVKTRDAHSHH